MRSGEVEASFFFDCLGMQEIRIQMYIILFHYTAREAIDLASCAVNLQEIPEEL